jgi:hypothetical protein
MKKAYLIILIFLLLLLGIYGCKSKQSLTEKEQVTEINTSEIISGIKEVEYRDRLIYLTKPVQSETVIDNPCKDGKLTDINTTIQSGGNISRVYTKDGKLYLTQHIDSTRNALEAIYSAKYKRDSIRLNKELVKEVQREKKKVVYVYPWWLYALGIGLILFLLLWLRSKFSLL